MGRGFPSRSELPWDELEQAAFSGMMDGLIRGRADRAHERAEDAARMAASEVVSVLMGGGWIRKPLTSKQVSILRRKGL